MRFEYSKIYLEIEFSAQRATKRKDHTALHTYKCVCVCVEYAGHTCNELLALLFSYWPQTSHTTKKSNAKEKETERRTIFDIRASVSVCLI